MTEAAPIHVVDDDDAMRHSLVFLLASAALKAISHESAESFLESMPSGDVGCVVTDVRMPGMSGLDLVRRLRDIDGDLPVIVVTGQSDVSLAIEALQAGAFDFIEKPFEDERLIAAVQSALAHSPHDWKEDKANAMARLKALTERERRVLDDLATGQANSVIANRLGISPHAVEIDRANIMDKLNATSLTQIVRIALMARGDEGSGAV